MRKAITLLCLIKILSACKDVPKQSKEINSKENTAYVKFRIDTSTRYFSNCNILLAGDSLKFDFSDNNWYGLQIVKLKDTTYSDFFQTWAVTDSSFVKPIFKTIRQEIITNKEDYKKGDSIMATIKLLMAGYHTWPDKYIDTVILNGWIKTTID